MSANFKRNRRQYPGDLFGSRLSRELAIQRFTRTRTSLLHQHIRAECLPRLQLQPPPGDCPIAVVTHGMGESPAAMDEISRFYLERGFHVLSVLFKGHGGTSPNILHDGSAEDWCRQLVQTLNLAAAFSRRITLVGYSMGGAIATAIAAGYPGDLTHLVLISPALKPSQLLEQHTTDRIAANETWTSDTAQTRNRYMYDLISTQAFAQYLEISRTAQSIIGSDIAYNDHSISCPISLIDSEADSLVHHEFNKNFIDHYGARGLVLPKSMRVKHQHTARWSEYKSWHPGLLEKIKQMLLG